MRPLNDAWFELVNSFTKHWSRKDDTTLTLYFDGVAGCDPGYWPMEKTFSGPNTTQGFVIGSHFDRMSGKTFVTVKEPLNVLEERMVSRLALVDSLDGEALKSHIDELKQAIEVRREHGYDVRLDEREVKYAVSKQTKENEV